MREPWIVQTPDGGAVAVWVEGTGPPLVLVHGSMCDHTAFGPLTEALRDAVSIFALDRRGFGASEDDPGYTADREFADVAAVVDAVAERTDRALTLRRSPAGSPRRSLRRGCTSSTGMVTSPTASNPPWSPTCY